MIACSALILTRMVEKGNKPVKTGRSIAYTGQPAAPVDALAGE